MFTRIDHVVIAVPDLGAAIAQYRKLGFDLHPGGAHPGMGTHNAIALNQEDYIELLAICDPAEQKAAAARPGSWVAGLDEFIAAGGGIRYIVVQSDDPRELLTSYLMLRDRPELARSIRTDGRATAKRFVWPRILEGYESVWETAFALSG